MIQEAEVRERLAAFASGSVSLRDFEAWLKSASWNMHRDSAPEAIELASSIHSLMSERDDGVLDANEFRQELVSLLNNVSDTVLVGALTVPCDMAESRIAGNLVAISLENISDSLIIGDEAAVISKPPTAVSATSTERPPRQVWRLPASA